MLDKETSASSAIVNCRIKEQTRNESLDGITLDSYSQSLNCWIKLPESRSDDIFSKIAGYI